MTSRDLALSTFSIELNAGILARMDIYAIRKQQLIKLIGNRKKGACAERWGMAPAHLSQILSDKTAKNLGDDVARRIEIVEKLPRGWFDSITLENAIHNRGTLDFEPSGEADAPDPAKLIQQVLAKQDKGTSVDILRRLLTAAESDDEAGLTSIDRDRPGAVGDEVWIAHYDISAVIGGKQTPRDYPEMLQDVRISPKHLREMGVEFQEHIHLKIATGWGQSMAPTIKHRDPLLLDVSVRDFKGDGIYMFTWEGHFYIKRLQWIGDKQFSMISDNARHQPRTIRAEETEIQARVLLVWNAQLL
jgi:hypothetical protein